MLQQLLVQSRQPGSTSELFVGYHSSQAADRRAARGFRGHSLLELCFQAGYKHIERRPCPSQILGRQERPLFVVSGGIWSTEESQLDDLAFYKHSRTRFGQLLRRKCPACKIWQKNLGK